MQTQHDGAADPAEARATVFAAFGMLLDVDPRIDGHGLGLAATAGGPGLADARAPASLPTRVSLDPHGLKRRWSSCSSTARRMRELRDGEHVLLSVDLAEPAGYLLRADEVGSVLITTDGTELLCDPLPDRPGWAMILPAQALPLAATLRGLEVIHAAGVVLGEGAALFAGPPGLGKSSLAGAFLRRGARLLSDDVVALTRHDGSLIAHPGGELLQLRPAERDRLSDEELAVFGTDTPFAGKHRYAPQVSDSPSPLRAFFLLERATRGRVIEHLEAVDPFALLATTFNLSVRTPERLERQLDVVETLAASGRIYRLRVVPGIDATRLADIVEEHLVSVSR